MFLSENSLGTLNSCSEGEAEVEAPWPALRHSTRFYAVDPMFGRFRVLVSVSAAFPISPTDGEVVYNFRGTLDTANFLGQLFRTFSDVLNLGNRQEQTGTAASTSRSGKP